MAATLASVCSVPLTSILLLFELTKDYRILLPLMVSLSSLQVAMEILSMCALRNKPGSSFFMQSTCLIVPTFLFMI